MAIAKVILNGVTQMDVTDKTVTAGSMLSGTTALKNDGTDITGSIESKTSSDLTASGATVTAPAGYYASAASKSVASGSASTPATTITADPTVSVNSSGLITATVSKTQNVTPSVSAGYVASGTAGTITISGSGTSQLTTQAAQTIHPSTTDQTIASGKYLTGAQTIKAVTTTNLTAANIVQGVTVKIGDSTDDDCVASVTGTAETGGGVDASYKAVIQRDNAEVALPDDLTKVGNYAFYDGRNLRISSLPSGITTIGSYAFGLTAITVTSLPDGITSIGTYAFHGCSNLALTSLPSGLTTIPTSCFQNCTRLALTSLPSGVTTIDSNAFDGCTGLTISALPSGVQTINTSAFANCYAITLTSLPDSVTTIGASAFARCVGMTSISCNGAITTLSNNAFTGNSSHPMQLAHVSFPNMAVSSLGYVFGSTTPANACQLLEDADVGNTAAIAANAFANCYKLQTLILRKTGSICTLANISAFTSTPMRGYNSLSGTIYVPSALISTYQTATNWSTIYGEGHVTFAAIEGSEYEL